MNARFVVRELHDEHIVPRPDLPGSPYPSRKVAKRAAAGLAAPTDIVPVRRRTA